MFAFSRCGLTRHAPRRTGDRRQTYRIFTPNQNPDCPDLSYEVIRSACELILPGCGVSSIALEAGPGCGTPGRCACRNTCTRSLSSLPNISWMACFLGVVHVATVEPVQVSAPFQYVGSGCLSGGRDRVRRPCAGALPLPPSVSSAPAISTWLMPLVSSSRCFCSG